MDLGNALVQEQRQVLSPRQIESINILAMDAQDLYEFALKEQEENPIIVPISGEPFRTVGIDSGHDDFIMSIPAPEANTARDLLLPQINLNDYSEEECAAFQLIADSLDESGRLPETPLELSGFSGIPVGVLQKCIAVMKKLEPIGVCASSLAECLELQLDALGRDDELLLEIIRRHLQDVADVAVNRIVTATGQSACKVKECIKIIRSLNPLPLNGLIGEGARNITPDIILTQDGDSWSAELNNGGFRAFEVCDYYVRMARETSDEDLREYFRQKIQRVNFLNEAIEKRRDTLTRIARMAALRQSDFLLRGGAPVALTMNAAAGELGLHPSTVGRAVRGKYVQHPGGVCELRALFARGAESAASVQTADSGVSREGVKRMIRELVASEDKEAPLSDDRIVAMLMASGVDISRRTAAKYRGEMGISGMHNRI